MKLLEFCDPNDITVNTGNDVCKYNILGKCFYLVKRAVNDRTIFKCSRDTCPIVNPSLLKDIQLKND